MSVTESPRATDSTVLRQLADWMDAQEGERLEFKEAKNRYDFTELTRYLCALANEGGGRMLLGVTDVRPRRVVGSASFPQVERLRANLLEKLPVRIDVDEIRHPDGRVLVITVAGRPVGTPIQVDDRYWSRRGDRLTTMPQQRLREVFAESGHDFSGDVCVGAGEADLDLSAVESFRRRWIAKSGNQALVDKPVKQVLRDAELFDGDGATYAALVLFGTRAALGRHLAQAEVVFEYRSGEAAGPAQQRQEYRLGFFAFVDELWQTINLRNDLQHYQDGLFVLDVPTFAERSVREAILNAVSHRDYQLGGSVFVRQYARRLVVESPGGLPFGVTLDNVLDRQSPRNRRIAEALARCGLVERAGQGMNLMFEQSIRQGKARPDFTGTDAWHVVVTLHGEVRDVKFLRFLERVGKEKQVSFGTADLLVLDLVHRDQAVPGDLRESLRKLREAGVVETVGRGAGTRYLLSSSLYKAAGQGGEYTRRRGLDDATNKELLLKHLGSVGERGCAIADLQLVLPALSRSKVRRLLHELAEEGRARLTGSRRGAKWGLS